MKDSEAGLRPLEWRRVIIVISIALLFFSPLLTACGGGEKDPGHMDVPNPHGVVVRPGENVGIEIATATPEGNTVPGVVLYREKDP